MRDIKFRGKRKDIGWKYGWLSAIENISGTMVSAIRPFDEYNIRYGVDPESVGQYTGRKDGDDREIFEGDRLSNGSLTGIVEWRESRAGWVLACPKGDIDFLFAISQGYVLVGNIYEEQKV